MFTIKFYTKLSQQSIRFPLAFKESLYKNPVFQYVTVKKAVWKSLF